MQKIDPKKATNKLNFEGFVPFPTLDVDLMSELGGSGSGNYGHAGRPGHVGGSAPNDMFVDEGEGLEPVTSLEHENARKFKPGAKKYMDEEVSDEFEKWEDGLEYEQIVILSRYSGSTFLDVNDYLRHHEEYVERTKEAFTYKKDGVSSFDQNEVDEHLKSIADQIPVIDKALKWSDGFSDDTIVYRGIDYDPHLDIGDEITDEGFMSTSLDKNIAVDFTGEGRYRENHMFEINWPAGKPIGYLNNISEVPGEMEMLIPRGVTLRVDGVRTENRLSADKHYRYDMKVYQLSYVEGISDLSLDFVFITELGGKGSGNFKHKGRKGQVGGSEDDGVPNAQPTQSQKGPRRFGGSENIHEQATKEFSSWEKDLEDDEMSVISGYVVNDYRFINDTLRYGENEEGVAPDEAREYAYVIDRALEKSPGFKQDTAVYRGIDYLPNMEVGDTFLDRGFSSTTLDADVAAENFSALGGDQGVLLEINWPKGVPCGYVSNIGGNTVEAEVLLPRNAEFEVTNISNHQLSDGLNIKVYHMNLVDVYKDEDLED